MSKKRKTFCMVISFLGTILFAVVLYAEKRDYEQTEAELQQIVAQDFTQTENFFRQNPEEMQSWAQYLGLSEAQSMLNQKGSNAQKRVMLLMTSLHFAQGAKNYPVFVNLYESLSSLQNWRHRNFMTAAFRGQSLLAELKSKRASGKNASTFVLRAVNSLSAAKKMELEKAFFAQLETKLPAELTASSSQSHSTMTTENGTVLALNAGQSPVARSANAATLSPLHRKNKALLTGSDSADSTLASSENVSQTQSGTIRSALPHALRTAAVPLPSFLQNQFIPTLMDSGNFVKTRQLAETIKTEQTEAPKKAAKAPEKAEETEDSLLLPDLPATTKNQPQACDDVNALANREARKISEKKASPEDSIPAIPDSNAKETDSQSNVEDVSSTPSETPEPEKIQESGDGDFPPLPFLHYSLVETVGAVSGAAPKYEGKETLEELQESLTGDFTKDLETIRQCWLAESFRAPSEEDLTVAYEAIGVISDCFNDVLQRLSEEKRQSWINILHLNQLNLNEEPNLALLQDVEKQFSSGKIGMEMEIFVNFREAIRHYLVLVQQQKNPEKAKELFEMARLRVLKLLEIVKKDHSNINERALEDELVWLDCMGQANATVQATRSMWNHSNIFLNADSSIFERYGSRVIEEEENISNNISRTSIRGKALFNGNLMVKPAVNENRVELEIVLDGSSSSRTQAYAGPAIVSSRAKSRILVQKSIYFDEAGFESDSADVQIRTNSQIEDVQDVRNRAIIQNIATRRAYAQKSSMEQSANAQSSQRLRQRFDSQIDSMLDDWNEQISILFQKHFRPRGFDQNETHSRSDAAGVYVETRLTCRNAMGAYTTPPEMPKECDLQMAIHETMIQNAFTSYLAGLNLNAYARQHLKNTAPAFIQKALSSESSAEDSNANWTMYFPESWPVSVSFQDGKVCCVIHVERLDYEGKSYPAVDITVYYGIEARPDGFYLVREGNVGIFPPDFNPEQKKRLPPSMISLRRVLGKRLEKEFTPEIVLKEQKLVKDSENQKSNFQNLWMKPVFVQTKDGWLMVGMNLIEKEPAK